MNHKIKKEDRKLLERLGNWFIKQSREFNPEFVTTYLKSYDKKHQKELHKILTKDNAQRLVGIMGRALTSNYSKYEASRLRSLKKEKQKLQKKDSRIILLERLFKEVNRKRKYLVFLILRDFFDYKDHFRRLLEPADLLLALQSRKREARARYLLRAYREIVEMSYQKYLIFLWILSSILLDDRKLFPKSLGDYCRQLPLRLGNNRSLVDPDVAFIRNAAAHGDWEYNSRSNTVILRDKKKIPLELTLRKLEMRLEGIYFISGPILLNLINRYAMTFYQKSGLADGIHKGFKYLVEKKYDRLNEIENNIAERMKKMFQT